ncbi:MAG TPA: CHAD domain-containing protein, partial [Nitrolancea sp.]|nr:CHAD domain-containing protein [Nitrolancea sp.]
WLKHPPLSLDLTLSKEAPIEQLNTYFDTDDWRIYRAGYALRLRRRNDRAEFTLKSIDPRHSAYSARREVTQRLPLLDNIEVEQLDGVVGDRVQALRGKRSINPLFTEITRRQPYGLWYDSGRIGELSLDNTTFIGETFDDQSQLLRIEIESANGEIERLQPFVEQIRADLMLTAASASKFVTGLSIHRLEPVEPVTPASLSFDQSSSIVEVAYAILARQLTEFIRREPGTRLGDDIEELHDMRVAARRLRAALSLFSAFLPAEFDYVGEELRWVASALGEVRDLDVQLGEISGWISQVDEPDGIALDALLDELRRRRTASRERMLTVLNSERYERMTAEFTQLLSSRDESLDSSAANAIAPNLVFRRQRKFSRKADRIKPDSANEAFHAVRIDAKRLRYALEFLSPLYGKGVTDYIRQLVAVQDLIGKHQDAVVAIENLRNLANETTSLTGPTVFAMGRIAERYAEDARHIRVQFPEAYRELEGKRLARLESELRTQPNSKHAKRKRKH